MKPDELCKMKLMPIDMPCHEDPIKMSKAKNQKMN